MLAWLRTVLTRRHCAALFAIPAFVIASLWQFTNAADLTRSPSQMVQRNWAKMDGLPAEFIWGVHYSETGYLWIATDAGLARFDGLEFQIFSSATHDAIKSSEIRDVAEGPDGSIWAASLGGGLIHLHKGQITRFDVDNGLVSDAVYSVMVTTSGDTWAGTASGACRLRADTIRCWTPADGVADGRIVRLAEDPENRIWLASLTGGLSVFADDEMRTFGSADGLKAQGIPMLIAHPESNVLIGDLSGSYYRADETGVHELARGSLPDSVRPFNATLDRDGNVLIGMLGSLWQFQPQIRRLDNPADKIAYVTDVDEDGDGGLWVGTSAGLYQYRAGPFTPYGESEGVSDQTYVVAAGIDDSVWVGTELDGLFNVHPDGTIRQYTTVDGLPSNSVSSIMVEENGIVWAGTFGGGVARLQNGALVDVINGDHGLLGNQVGSIYRDRAGSVWIGTNAGLNRWDDGRVRETMTVDDGLLANLSRDVRQDQEGRLLVSSDNGLTIVSPEAFQVVDTIDSRQGLTNDAVAATYVDSDGVIWIGGRSGGLTRLEREHLFHFEEEHNVSLTSVMAIVEDDQSQLWLAGRDGIVRIPKSELDAVARGDLGQVSAVVFSGIDGLRSARVTGGYQSPAARANDGRVWFATSKGLAATDPAMIQAPISQPRVQIEAVRADGKNVAGGPPYRIPAGAQSVQVDYSVPSLNAAQSLRFRYRMAATRWQDAGERRTAFFTSLPPRENVFQVAATIDGQPFIEDEVQSTDIELYMEPRWVQMYSVRVMLLIVTFLLVWACYGFALRHYRHRQKHLEELVGERTDALKKALDEVEAMSRIDILTGIANRRHFEERLREEWSRAIRNEQSLTVMMIDIDHFKEYNDSAGHQAGDHCLTKIAQALRASIREEDFVARYGGEEFCVLLSGSDIKAMCEIGKRLQDGIRDLRLDHPGLPGSATVTVSAGFATATPGVGDSSEELIRRADEALYRAKMQGRDRVIVDRPSGQDSLTITGAYSLAN